MTKTTITIRAQALGGKFLADDIGGAQITVRDVADGRVLAAGRTQGTSSGAFPSPSPSQWQPGASPSAIINVKTDPPTVYWVVADETTSRFDAVLEIDQPTLVEITATGPGGGLQSTQPATVRQWVIPGQNITPPAGLVVVIPGLLVQVLDPPTHSAVKPGETICLEANVAMMCGCPITWSMPAGPNPAPWTPDNFEVSALIQRLDSADPAFEILPVPMPFIKELSPGRFWGEFKVPPTGGFYQATITAVQPATGNTGTGTVTFFT